MLKKLMKNIVITLAAASIALVPMGAALAETSTGQTFDPALAPYYPIDIEDHWAYDQLADLVDADIVRGFVNSEGDTEVRPNKSITRAEFVTFLVKGMGLSEVAAPKAKVFTDVKSSDWFYTFVNIATSLNIASGKSESKFEPNALITRGEIATMVVNAFNQTISFDGEAKVFRDIPDYWAKPFIEKASRAGIISGYEGGLFKPLANATRAEGLVILYNALGKETSALTDDSVLENVVLDSEKAFTAAVNNADFSTMDELTDRYALGYYKALVQVTNEQFEDFIEAGVKVELKLIGDMTATVVDKTDRFAVVDLTGAVYEGTVDDGENVYTFEQDSSGTAYLRKVMDSNGAVTWKIYALYPNTEEEQTEAPTTTQNES